MLPALSTPGRYEVFFSGSIQAYYYRMPGEFTIELVPLDSSQCTQADATSWKLHALKPLDSKRKTSMNGTFWLGEIDMPWHCGASVTATWFEHERCSFNLRHFVFRYMGHFVEGDSHWREPFQAVEIQDIVKCIPQQDALPAGSVDELCKVDLDKLYGLRRLQAVVNCIMRMGAGAGDSALARCALESMGNVPLADYLREHVAEDSGSLLDAVGSADIRLAHVLAFARFLVAREGEASQSNRS